jgi:hypothetical protein
MAGSHSGLLPKNVAPLLHANRSARRAVGRPTSRSVRPDQSIWRARLRPLPPDQSICAAGQADMRGSPEAIAPRPVDLRGWTSRYAGLAKRGFPLGL